LNLSKQCDLVQAVLDVGGNKLNALAIEHFILRQPSNKEVSISELGYVESLIIFTALK